ncbi:hypothetical protein PR048_028007 [Dryococelus australis]|uniref:Uncharacterized protein n=1 Tax=Dryococelus australis TaxID=614101 RepID=A0ABQ9GI21_9NEOP|nr:hypothetical protein PR048_028007 [Dryococelus australis]
MYLMKRGHVAHKVLLRVGSYGICDIARYIEDSLSPDTEFELVEIPILSRQSSDAAKIFLLLPQLYHLNPNYFKNFLKVCTPHVASSVAVPLPWTRALERFRLWDTNHYSVHRVALLLAEVTFRELLSKQVTVQRIAGQYSFLDWLNTVLDCVDRLCPNHHAPRTANRLRARAGHVAPPCRSAMSPCHVGPLGRLDGIRVSLFALAENWFPLSTMSTCRLPSFCVSFGRREGAFDVCNPPSRFVREVNPEGNLGLGEAGVRELTVTLLLLERDIHKSMKPFPESSNPSRNFSAYGESFQSLPVERRFKLGEYKYKLEYMYKFFTISLVVAETSRGVLPPPEHHNEQIPLRSPGVPRMSPSHGPGCLSYVPRLNHDELTYNPPPSKPPPDPLADTTRNTRPRCPMTPPRFYPSTTPLVPAY